MIKDGKILTYAKAKHIIAPIIPIPKEEKNIYSKERSGGGIDTDQESSSFLDSFHSTGRCCAGYREYKSSAVLLRCEFCELQQ